MADAKQTSFLGRAARTYRVIVLVVANTVLLLAIVTVALSVYYGLTDEARKPGTPEVLRVVYPTRSLEAVECIVDETWTPLMYEPFVQFRERPREGRFTTVDEHGFRHSLDQAPWPPQRDRFNVFVFGGSTTFGYGLPDEEAIGSCLQRCLRSQVLARAPANRRPGEGPVAVYNFGCGSHYSTQERILFECLLTSGFIPDLALFIDGMNDFYFVDDEPAFTDVLRKLTQTDGPGLGDFVNQLAIMRAAVDLKEAIVPPAHAKPRAKQPDGRDFYDHEPTLRKVIHRYLQNKRLIEAAAAAYGVTPVFVWQPVPMFGYDLRYHPFADEGFGRFTFSRYGYPYVKKLVAAGVLGERFLWCGDMQSGVQEALYVDPLHYTAAMTERFARTIRDMMVERKLLRRRTPDG